eukprot:Hpha_TRINITY_DN34022_c0_g1::TRINITY_DN34022_c0_g1_i1::g.30618::m.30618/K03355/APC8, CDC23; anaphase-promoting complex subunit 8
MATAIGQPSHIQEVRIVAEQCRGRGLLKAATWLGEILTTLPAESASRPAALGVWMEPAPPSDPRERRNLLLGRASFARGEYVRTAWQLSGACTSAGMFLGCYALYLAGETERECARLRGDGKQLGSNPKLREVLGRLEAAGAAVVAGDPFLLWMRGVCLRALKEEGRLEEATEAFVACVRLQPGLWAGWQELIALGPAAVSLAGTHSVGHWAAGLAQAEVYAAQLDWSGAVRTYRRLGHVLGQESVVLMHGKAVVCRRQRRWADAISLFEHLLERHPNRIDLAVEFSHSLFVSRLQGRTSLAKLSALAQRAYTEQRYAAHTLVILGDHCTALHQHDKALLCFRRARRLDPHNFPQVSALIAQEWTELKSPAGACEEHAAELQRLQAVVQGGGDTTEHSLKQMSNVHNGLGVTYELLGAHPLAEAHYLAAARLHRSTDAAAPHWCGVAAVARAMHRHRDAFQCYRRMEDTAEILLFRAQAAEDQGDDRAASEAFTEYLNRRELWPLPSLKWCVKKVDEEAVTAIEFLVRYWKREAEELCAREGKQTEVRRSELLQRALDACELLNVGFHGAHGQRAGPAGEREALLADLRSAVGGFVDPPATQQQPKSGRIGPDWTPEAGGDGADDGVGDWAMSPADQTTPKADDGRISPMQLMPQSAGVRTEDIGEVQGIDGSAQQLQHRQAQSADQPPVPGTRRRLF